MQQSVKTSETPLHLLGLCSISKGTETADGKIYTINSEQLLETPIYLHPLECNISIEAKKEKRKKKEQF